MAKLEPKIIQLFFGDVKRLIPYIEAISRKDMVVFSEINSRKHLGQNPNPRSWMCIMLVHWKESSMDVSP